MPKNVVVVGMPRSGTSLVAGIFARQGWFVAADPGQELRQGDHHNPGGYWEAEVLTRVNARLFGDVGYAEDTTWLGAPIPPEAAERLPHLPPRPEHRQLVARYQAHAPWVWKDPRLCYTLGYWWPLLPAADTRVVLTRRDPEAIWRSFVRLHWRDATPEARADVLARVEGHLAAAEAAIARLSIPHVAVRYEDFSADPDGVARLLSELIDVELEAAHLAFSAKLDHSAIRGRVATFLEHGYERLPASLRGAVKRLTPRTLVHALFPERKAADGE